MASLLRIARQSELSHEGQKLVKEVYGRKILLARTGGQVYATDAHCYHMGGNLWEGDIEDIDGHACVVCPLHRYRIDMSTGQKVDRMLDGCVSCSSGPQQRTYKVFVDSEFIRIDIPELHAQQALPSDKYNQVAAPQPTGSTPGRGLVGSSSGGRGLVAAEPLAPFAGFGARSLVPGTPERDAAEEPALMLSQEAQQPAQQQQQPANYAQGHISFPQARRETAWSMRRKIATEAIKNRAYVPPSAPPLQQLQQPAAARGLFSTGAAPAQQQQQGGLARTASNGGQQSLFAFGFTQQPRPALAASGPEDMEM